MYDAMCKATTLSGFTVNVLDIKERKSYAKTKKIKNILKIHHVKYDYSDKSQTKFHVCNIGNIGPGKKIDTTSQPKVPKYEEKMKFYDGGEKFGFVSDKKEHSATSSHKSPCTNESCILTFQSFAKLERHLNFGHHCYKERNATKLAMVADKWVKRFEGTVEQRSSNADKINEGRQLESNLLKMGWAIPERVQRRLTAAQKEFLNKLLDDGEKSGNKVSAEKAKQKMRKTI